MKNEFLKGELQNNYPGIYIKKTDCTNTKKNQNKTSLFQKVKTGDVVPWRGVESIRCVCIFLCLR